MRIQSPARFGSEENRNLLVYFLNAILADDLAAPITEVEILNPYNDKEFLDDKLRVVDVKARDGGGRLYQIERLCCFNFLHAQFDHPYGLLGGE